MAFIDIVRAVAPGIASIFGGPVAGAAVEYLAGKLGASAPTVDAIQQTLSGMTGDQLVKLKEIDEDFQKFCLTNNIALDLAQLDVNKVEAANQNMFVAGWRPFVGWVGGFGLLYVSILEPLLRFAASVGFHYTGNFPVIDTTITMQVLLGLLGLGAMRSYDKTNGVGNGH